MRRYSLISLALVVVSICVEYFTAWFMYTRILVVLFGLPHLSIIEIVAASTALHFFTAEVANTSNSTKSFKSLESRIDDAAIDHLSRSATRLIFGWILTGLM